MDWHASEAEVRSEKDAQRYLGHVCWADHQRFCTRCGSRKPYQLSSGRHRCRRCGYTFSEFSRRWLSQSRLTCSEWLTLVRLFEAEESVDSIAAELGRAHATVFHAVTILRAAILAHNEACAALLYSDPSMLLRLCAHHAGRKALRVSGHVPVFGIRDQNGSASVPVLPDLTPEFVLGLLVKKVRRGRIVYTGQVSIYDTLIFSDPDLGRKDRDVKFSRTPPFIDGTNGFWAFAAPRLADHHGVSPEHFPLYIKELEFRYNHREEPQFPLLVGYLCDFLPRAAGTF